MKGRGREREREGRNEGGGGEGERESVDALQPPIIAAGRERRYTAAAYDSGKPRQRMHRYKGW